jgi:mono/diheme cytochrome c family protein
MSAWRAACNSSPLARPFYSGKFLRRIPSRLKGQLPRTAYKGPVHRSIAPAAALAALLLTAGALSAKPAPAPYTSAQAADGAKLFAARCSTCHGARLQGVSAPSLLSANLPGAPSVAEVYAVMSTQMPADAPGTLKPAQYAAIMAFLLQANHHAASGTAVLTDARAKSLSTQL